MASRLGCVLAVATAVLGFSVSGAFAQSSATYTYDALGRLLTSSNTTGSTTYTYDNAGNRTAVVSCVSSCNHAPVANPDGSPTPINVAYGGSVVIPVLANDTDADGDALTVTSATGANKGSTSLTGGNTTVTYQATVGQIGADSFTYAISDGHGGTATSTVAVNILPQVPIAGAVTNFPVPYNAVNYPITLSFSGGTPTSANVIAPGASHGTAAPSGGGITYSPTPNQSAPDSFYYSGTNAGGTGNQALVTIIVGSAPLQVPQVGPQSAIVSFNSTNNSIAPVFTGGGAATSVLPGTPNHSGTATPSGLNFIYAPQTGFSGTETFTYTASNSSGQSNQSLVTVTVNPAPPQVGDVPGATATFNSTNNPIAAVFTGGGVATSLALVGTPDHGGTVTTNGVVGFFYTPHTGFWGTEHFTYTASNAGGPSNQGTVTVTIPAPSVHVSPTPTWTNINGTGFSSPYSRQNTNQTLQGFTGSITLQLVASGTGGTFAYSLNNGAWTTWSSGATISVSNNDVLKFQVTAVGSEVDIGTIQVYNVSDANTLLNQFSFDVEIGS